MLARALSIVLATTMHMHQHYGTMEGGAENNTASTSINTITNTTIGGGNTTSISNNTSDDITRHENQILQVIIVRVGTLSEY